MTKRKKLTRRRKIELSRTDPAWKRKAKEKLRRIKEKIGAPEDTPMG